MADAPRPLDASLDPAAPEDGATDSAPGGASRYQVTARKYRPQTFGEMVGQAHVAQTLQNAIRLDRLAHAYLFSGPRGVGKTTAARILAKAVNCTTPLAEREGAEPCRTCDSCRAFEDGRSMNIIEIDAASNNKVDDIRELRETVRVPPQGAKKKIYILDEVHMLSQGAFNALLKTLEEPPPHVLFIFATTEPHKVLPTILSRTQRFDFRRIAVPEIVGRLDEICAEEGVEAEDEALMLIARKGDGALRDALSLFDQAVSLVGTPLRADALRDALGVVDTDLFFETTEKAQAQDRAGLLGLVDRLVRRGYDLPEYLGGLAEHVRHLLVAASTGASDLIEATDAMRQRYLDAARGWAEADLLHLLMLVDEAEMGIKASRQPRLTTELALLKMASLAPAADLTRLLAKLERLEAALAEGKRLPSDAAPTPPKAAPKASAEPTPGYAATPPEAPEESPSDADDADDGGGEPMTFSPEPPRRPTGDAPKPEAPASSAPAAQSLFGTPALPRRKPSSGDGADGAPSAALPSGDGASVAPPLPALPGASLRNSDDFLRSREASEAKSDDILRESDDFGVPLARVRELWPRLVAAVKAERVHVGALLQLAAPHRAAKGAVEVAVPDDFARSLLESEAASLTAALGALLGEAPPALRFVVGRAEAGGEGGETAADVDPFERLKQLRQEHPVFRALFEKFGAEIVW